jgi:FkbM family methyltransferase
MQKPRDTRVRAERGCYSRCEEPTLDDRYGGRRVPLILVTYAIKSVRMDEAARFRHARRLLSRALYEDQLVGRNRIDDMHLQLVLASVLDRDATGIDVGAHSGGILREILRVAPAGHHVAFEPLPAMASRLRLEFPTADIREIAICDVAGESSFLHVRDAPAYSGLRRRGYPGDAARSLETITVRTARLDDEIGDLNPAFIKIDVEGGELQVLEGGVETLTRTRPTLWLEHGRTAAKSYGATAGRVWDLLADVGLRVYDADARGPFSRGAFEESVGAGRIWNYLAHR